MKTALIPFLFVVATLTGCGSAANEEELVAFAQDASRILKTSGEGELSRDSWSSPLSNLEPTRVYVTKEGLYLVISSSFADERGLFVPRNPDFAPQAGTDPTYTPVRSGVFAYRIKG